MVEQSKVALSTAQIGVETHVKSVVVRIITVVCVAPHLKMTSL